jgi:hypothetical protein
MSNVMPPLNSARTSQLGLSAVVAPRHACSTAGASALVAHGQAGLLMEPARRQGSGSSLVCERTWRVAASGRPWAHATRLSRWGRVVACERSAFAVGAAHNWSLERTAQRPLRALWSAAQLQRYAPA